MKKLYQRFNRLNIELDQQPIEVSEHEKARIKNKVLNRKSTKTHPKTLIVAALIFSVILSFVAIGNAYPSFAAKLPVIGNIFNYFNDHEKNVFHDYAAFSKEIELTEISNGIEITINNAIYDGENVTLAYSIKSDRDLGEDIYPDGFIFGNQHDLGYTPRHNLITKTGEHEYIGILMTSLMQRSPDQVQVDWEVKELYLPQLNKTIYGDWNFKFTLEALEGKTVTFDNLETTKNDIKVILTKHVATPVSNTFSIHRIISQEHPQFANGNWAAVHADYIVKDDLGNEYETMHNGTFGNDMFHVTTRLSTKKINENASYVTITPTVIPVKFKDNGTTELQETGESFTLDPIQVPLK
ncbi:DUF4179 domain-containing protein [Bacillaceae bacterium W0354]